MWVLTDVANWYDKQRKDNLKFLENTMDHADNDFLGAIVYTAAGTAWLLNALPGAFAGGYVDVLRLGDGVQEGGWGYGKDALRLLIVAGPALRLAKLGIGALTVAAVDETPTVGNCLWVQSTQALRLTKTQHYARIGDLAKVAGIAVADTGAASTTNMVGPLTQLGADVKVVQRLASFEEVANLARSNPKGVVIFGVKFMRNTQTPGGYSYLAQNGHALIAQSVGDAVVIVDRSGKIYTSLADVAAVYGGSAEMSMTVFAEEAALVVGNAKILTPLIGASLDAAVLNTIGLELRSVPGPGYAASDATVVLLTDKQLLTGWWWVWVDQFFWCYCFDPNGTVHWSDPFNHRSGTGKWRDAAGAVEIAWNSSATKERWSLPIMTGQQTGAYMAAGKPATTLKAMKIPGDTWSPLVGKWRVSVSKWTWNYDFTAYGGVTWVDPNNGQSGRGTWTFTKTTVYIAWVSATREEWSLPIGPGNQGGTCRMAEGTFPVSAVKLG